MGSRAVPIIAFGFPIGAEEEIEIDGFTALVEAADNCEDKDWPVELVSHGHHEYRFYFLAIRGTECGSGDWGDTIDIPRDEPGIAKIDAAKAWCAQHNIPWQRPLWRAMAAYR